MEWPEHLPIVGGGGVSDTALGMVELSMGGHERPYGLVLKTWD